MCKGMRAILVFRCNCLHQLDKACLVGKGAPVWWISLVNTWYHFINPSSVATPERLGTAGPSGRPPWTSGLPLKGGNDAPHWSLHDDFTSTVTYLTSSPPLLLPQLLAPTSLHSTESKRKTERTLERALERGRMAKGQPVVRRFLLGLRGSRSKGGRIR